MNRGVLNNPACGSGEKCVAVIGDAGTCDPITGLEFGAGGLGGGYRSKFGSGIQGGFMDAPGCEWLAKYECSDIKTRLRCPTRCAQGLGSDNEMLNLRGVESKLGAFERCNPNNPASCPKSDECELVTFQHNGKSTKGYRCVPFVKVSLNATSLSA